jgi:hypothetical protein
MEWTNTPRSAFPDASVESTNVAFRSVSLVPTLTNVKAVDVSVGGSSAP